MSKLKYLGDRVERINDLEVGLSNFDISNHNMRASGIDLVSLERKPDNLLTRAEYLALAEVKMIENHQARIERQRVRLKEDIMTDDRFRLINFQPTLDDLQRQKQVEDRLALINSLEDAEPFLVDRKRQGQ